MIFIFLINTIALYSNLKKKSIPVNEGKFRLALFLLSFSSFLVEKRLFISHNL